MKNVLILDTYNLLHRVRHTPFKGENHIVFNFFRSLRHLVETFPSDVVYCVIEGHPKQRTEIDPEYKQNRKIDPSDPKFQDLLEFKRQKDICLSILKEDFPTTTVQHQDYEADDVIYNLIKISHQEDNCTVVSTDTDFIQLLNEFKNVKLYNPIRKKFVDKPDFDYVKWKSLRGDLTDNIKGLKGIGDVIAKRIVTNEVLMERNMKDPEFKSVFDRNYSLIKFHDMEEDFDAIRVWGPNKNWKSVKSHFIKYKYFSIVNDKPWSKYISTFNCIINTQNLEKNNDC